MTDGSVIGYFESGGRRFLTELQDGSYTTTDSQICSFSIINGVYSDRDGSINL
jgi:hypothetical protein